MKCERCGRDFDVDGAGAVAPSGAFVTDGTQWDDEACNHCHLCLYDECEVFRIHARWLCNDCFQMRP